jgi:hypothetical protein
MVFAMSWFKVCYKIQRDTIPFSSFVMIELGQLVIASNLPFQPK